MICHLHPYTINHLHDAEYVKYLGKGAFGKVKLYKCKQQHLNCKCDKLFVVKQLDTSKLKNNTNNVNVIRKNLLSEYTIGTLLSHPCIRETLDVDFIEMSIIFEYCPGINFYNYLQNNKDNNLFYFKQFVDGVKYMHNIGIAHMDLKLENIMIDTIQKKLKIIDFGESKVFHDSLHCDTFILEKGIYGSIPYIAPEEFTQKQYNPEKVDVWSILIILYEVLYNILPWRKADNTDISYVGFFNYFTSNTKKLIPRLFKNNKFNKLDELFICGLNPNPDLRCDVNYIQTLLDNVN